MDNDLPNGLYSELKQ